MKRLMGILALSLVLVSSQTVLGDVTWNGDTSGGPTFNRPSGLATLSGTATAVLFFLQPFYVDLTAQYVFEIDSTTPLTHTDQYALVYANSFSSVSPLNNLIAGDDDYPGGYTILSGSSASAGEGSRIALGETSNFGGAATGLLLTAGIQYFAVVAGFGNADFGTYRAALGDGPGGGTVTLGSIPEPSAVAILASFVLAGLSRRGRKTIGSRTLA